MRPAATVRCGHVQLAQRNYHVSKGGHEQTDHDLARLVLNERLDDAGENWPMASCTTTIVIVSTSAARLTMEAATVERIAIATSGAQTTDTNHRPFRMLSSSRDSSGEPGR